MNETVIVIMLKDQETGFLDSEIGSYNIADEEGLIYNIYAVKEGAITVYMRLTVERELLDWEFSAVLDYYDPQRLLEVCQSFSEDDTGYNPIWEVAFPFSESREEMEGKISRILEIHKGELESVYETITDYEDDYK